MSRPGVRAAVERFSAVFFMVLAQAACCEPQLLLQLPELDGGWQPPDGSLGGVPGEGFGGVGEDAGGFGAVDTLAEEADRVSGGGVEAPADEPASAAAPEQAAPSASGCGGRPRAEIEAVVRVAPGTWVELDGRRSSDPDGDALLFFWSQRSGRPVTLAGGRSSVAGFTAPADTGVLSFELWVSDGTWISLPVQVEITVGAAASGQPEPTAPTGEIEGPDEPTQEGGVVVEEGGSALPEAVDEPAEGVVVVEEGPGQPTVNERTTGEEPLEPNAAPRAVVSAPAEVFVGERAVLDGLESEDPEGGALRFRWSQTGGEAVVLSEDGAGTASFVAASPGRYVIALEVEDAAGASERIEVEVEVRAWGGVALDLASRPFRYGLEASGERFGAALDGGRAYVAEGVQGLRIYDVRALGAIYEESAFFAPGEAVDVEVGGGWAWVGSRELSAGISTVMALDVTEPAQPTWMGELSVEGELRALAWSEGHVALGLADRVVLLDASSPARLAVVGELGVSAGGATDVAISGGEVYVVVSGRVWAAPVEGFASAAWTNVWSGPGARSVAAAGPWVAVGFGVQGRGGVRVFAAQGASWSLSGEVLTSGEVLGVALRGGQVFAADTADRLYAVSLEGAPRLEGTWHVEGQVGPDDVRAGVAVDGERAIVTRLGQQVGGGWLPVVRLGSPQAPSLTPLGAAPAVIADVRADEGLLYAAVEGPGLRIYDVATSGAPVLLGELQGNGISAASLALGGGALYLAAGAQGVHVVDVRDPAAPRLVGTAQVGGPAQRVEATLGRVFVAGAFEGVTVFEVGDQGALSWTQTLGSAPAQGLARWEGGLVVAASAGELAWYGAVGGEVVEARRTLVFTGPGAGLAVGGGLVAAVSGAEGLAVVEGATGAVLGRGATGPEGRSVAVDGGRVWVGEGSGVGPSPDVLSAWGVGAGGLEWSGVYDLPGAPRGLAPSGGAIYVAGGALGTFGVRPVQAAVRGGAHRVARGQLVRYEVEVEEAGYAVACEATGGRCKVFAPTSPGAPWVVEWYSGAQPGAYEIGIFVGEHRVVHQALRDRVEVAAP